MPPVWSEGHLRLAIEAAGVALWSWNVDTDHTDQFTMDPRGYLIWDVPISSEVTFEERDWWPEGAIMTLRMNKESLAS
jgi:hypothetical protein